MAQCIAAPSTITGGSFTILDSGAEYTGGTPYPDNAVAVYTCNSGYVLTGDPYSTCTSSAWTATPSCTLSSGDTITVNNNDTDNTNITSDIPDWLIWVIVAVCAVLIMLLITCVLICCCHLWGCYGPDGIFGDHHGNSLMRFCMCRCCRRGTMPVVVGKHCRTLPRRYLYDEDGRRFHMDDLGRRCYYEHRKDAQGARSVSVVIPDSPPPEKRSEVARTAFVGAVNDVMRGEKKEARDLPIWKPHVNPVRNINTSTK